MCLAAHCHGDLLKFQNQVVLLFVDAFSCWMLATTVEQEAPPFLQKGTKATTCMFLFVHLR
jgi:hypothetical protein